jgi:hypothetical protein
LDHVWVDYPGKQIAAMEDPRASFVADYGKDWRAYTSSPEWNTRRLTCGSTSERAMSSHSVTPVQRNPLLPSKARRPAAIKVMKVLRPMCPSKPLADG